MDIKRLEALRTELEQFVSLFDDCIKTAPSREHLRTYVRGQLGQLERKSIAPIALEAEVPVRSLQEFMAIHRWDQGAVRGRVQDLVMDRHASPNAIGIVDETSFAKKGDKTAGVQRQYCGATGKTDNCTVAVNLGYVTKDFHALVDSDLYLPEGWLADRDRCREAGIPDSVGYRPKWQIAVDLLKRSVDHGVVFKYLTADEEYGRCVAFRAEVARLGLEFVVEVPCSTSGWMKRPTGVEPNQKVATKGRRCRRRRLAPGSPPPRRLDALWKQRGPPWKPFHIKNTDKGPVVWQARAGRFFAWEQRLPSERLWLMVARNALDGEVKYFLSNAPPQTPLELLLHIAFSRAHIERLFEDSKSEIGLDHFEVRHYRPLMRHLILSMVSLLFLVEQTRTLRGEKLGVDNLPGPQRRGSAAGAGDQQRGANAPTDQGPPADRILAAIQPASPAITSAPTAPTTLATGHPSVQTNQVLQLFVAL